MSEKGIPTPELEKSSNVDILIKTRKIQMLSKSLERMLVCLKEAGNLVNKLNSIKNNYKECVGLFENDLTLIENNEVFDTDKIKSLQYESNLYTKNKLIQDYKGIETKYSELSEYFSFIDKDFYSQTLENIIEEMF